MRIDVRPAGRLRGQDPIDLMSALAPVVEALQASDADLSRVRVVCDWIQYRASFREPADYRPVLAAGWQANPDPGSPGRLAAAGLRGLGLGVIDVKTEQVETREQVATRIRLALRFVPPERLSINPDCGLRHLPPEIARAKLAVLVAGAADVRAELGGALT